MCQEIFVDTYDFCKNFGGVLGWWAYMAINVEITKSGNDNNLGLIRKFTKRVQGSGILSRLRSIRYSVRKPSDYVKKKKTLKKIVNKSKIRELIKMGKMAGTLE